MRKLFLSFLLALLVPMAAGAQEMYTVYDDGAKTFTFYYDNDRASYSGEVYDLDDGGYPQWPYGDWRGNITKVVFDASFADARPTTTCGWFYEFRNMTQIEGMEYLNTSEVTDMQSMFTCCETLTALDVSHFDTGNVMNMGNMFEGCSALTALDVSHFDTQNVTNMGCMFYECSALTTLDVSHFDTRNVTYMANMFEGCSALTALDVSHFDTHNVTGISSMFSGCSSLTNLDVSHFDTGNVNGDLGRMFSGCSSLTALDVSRFDTRKVISMYEMFRECSSLTALDVSHFEIGNVTDMSEMFFGCKNLKTIYCNNDWYGRGGREMFMDCTSLVGGVGTVFNGTKADASMAHPDTEYYPGYFTRKGDGGTGEWVEGDLNHDGKVDAADVVWLTNLIMNQK